MNVLPVNDAPVAGNNNYSVHAGRTLTVAAPGLLGNDSDPDGDVLSVTPINVTGLLSVQADGRLVVTPAAGFVGTSSFSTRSSMASVALPPARSLSR